MISLLISRNRRCGSGCQVRLIGSKNSVKDTADRTVAVLLVVRAVDIDPRGLRHRVQYGVVAHAVQCQGSAGGQHTAATAGHALGSASPPPRRWSERQKAPRNSSSQIHATNERKAAQATADMGVS